jgi:hypothetical protein
VAAIDRELVAGRGASIGMVEQEAENAATDGSVLDFSTAAYTLAGEASGRRAVKLVPGQWVEFTLTRPANALTLRYSIPDAPTGGGIDAPLRLTTDDDSRTLTLTSKYAWLYNQYPFSNDPNAGLLHPDWWITECGCVPAFTTPTPTFATPFRPMHFYDEQRVLLGDTLEAGDRVRFTVPTNANAAWTILDVVDFERVGGPLRPPRPPSPSSASEPIRPAGGTQPPRLTLRSRRPRQRPRTVPCTSHPASSRSTGTSSSTT